MMRSRSMRWESENEEKKEMYVPMRLKKMGKWICKFEWEMGWIAKLTLRIDFDTVLRERERERSVTLSTFNSTNVYLPLEAKRRRKGTIHFLLHFFTL
ncbi:hypothetical protein TSUD_182020 [Trifolium subterraneum]|uniref:Uncharacterized protein n=1 Tax=Trifolium subterraneum TaxID=3900 RepID=A0A2Z6P008_TRISU|nr:hypothetical protein TSUD_182020 [Trifolium subterraneum]